MTHKQRQGSGPSLFREDNFETFFFFFHFLSCNSNHSSARNQIPLTTLVFKFYANNISETLYQIGLRVKEKISFKNFH